jgi:hypothetical protein
MLRRSNDLWSTTKLIASHQCCVLAGSLFDQKNRRKTTRFPAVASGNFGHEQGGICCMAIIQLGLLFAAK